MPGTLEEQLAEAVQAVTRAAHDLEVIRKQFYENEERLLARLVRCGDERDLIARLIRARDWVPNATITQDYYDDPEAENPVISLHRGERVQLSWRGGGIIRRDGHVFYGEPELETDPDT